MAATAHFLTSNIVKLELLCRGNSLGTATGFFIKWNDQWALITNWHVLSRRNPCNGQPRHRSGGVPDTCRLLVNVLHDGELNWRAYEIALGDAMAGTATWLQHPREGQAVDIAALPVPTDVVGQAKDLFDPNGYDEHMFVDLGAEVFLPGFPLGVTAGGAMPIWKRASLASSLEFGDGINRLFYVDTASREGMSGAPCFAISNWKHYRLDRNTGKMSIVEQPISWRLLGVYSGRLNPSDNFEAQIGIVWRETLMMEVLNSGVVAGVRII